MIRKKLKSACGQFISEKGQIPKGLWFTYQQNIEGLRSLSYGACLVPERERERDRETEKTREIKREIVEKKNKPQGESERELKIKTSPRKRETKRDRQTERNRE